SRRAAVLRKDAEHEVTELKTPKRKTTEEVAQPHINAYGPEFPYWPPSCTLTHKLKFSLSAKEVAMGLLSSEFNTLNELFLDELKDIYDAEKRLCDAIPKLAESAHNPDLKQACNEHLRETETHCVRLERIFGALGQEPSRKTCAGIKGIISEGEDMVAA